MERRQVIIGAGIAATGAASLGAAGFPAPALASGRLNWRLVSRWPEEFPDQLAAARRLADRLATLSDGRLTLEILNADELGPYSETLDRVANGDVEMARSLSYDWRTRGIGFDIFTFVPFGMTEGERVIWLDHFGGQALWDALYAPYGVKPFLVGTVGPQCSGWFGEPISWPRSVASRGSWGAPRSARRSKRARSMPSNSSARPSTSPWVYTNTCRSVCSRRPIKRRGRSN